MAGAQSGIKGATSKHVQVEVGAMVLTTNAVLSLEHSKPVGTHVSKFDHQHKEHGTPCVHACMIKSSTRQTWPLNMLLTF